MLDHSMKSAQRTKATFTLIELLVGIAIIGILASILFPVFARARENARRASCQSNLKQFGLENAQYQQDYDGMLVAPGMAVASKGTYNCTVDPCGYPWQPKLYPYVKNTQIYRCPSGSTKQNNVDTSNNYYTANADFPGVPSLPTDYAFAEFFPANSARLRPPGGANGRHGIQLRGDAE